MFRRATKGLSRGVWFALGLISLALAALGVVLPLLPTTPLVILAAFAFSKSSPRFQRLLEESRTFGPIIADWRAKGAIAPRYKAMAVGMMGLAFGISVLLGVPPWVLIVQVVCLGGAATYVLSRPSV
ncbi:MAG: YbaN family protein [Silicimonas sp.]|nr:YbaN family protein [Silicimonas sp.]